MRRLIATTVVLPVVLLAAPAARADADMVPSSEYTGYFYTVNPNEPFRKCVAWRESRNTPTAVSRGNHQGLYQFTDALADGAAWMMMKDPLDPIDRQQRLVLQRTPMREWSRYWQARAFWTILNWLGPNSGAKHWFLSGSRCNRLGGL